MFHKQLLLVHGFYAALVFCSVLPPALSPNPPPLPLPSHLTPTHLNTVAFAPDNRRRESSRTELPDHLVAELLSGDERNRKQQGVGPSAGVGITIGSQVIFVKSRKTL